MEKIYFASLDTFSEFIIDSYSKDNKTEDVFAHAALEVNFVTDPKANRLLVYARDTPTSSWNRSDEGATKSVYEYLLVKSGLENFKPYIGDQQISLVPGYLFTAHRKPAVIPLNTKKSPVEKTLGSLLEDLAVDR